MSSKRTVWNRIVKAAAILIPAALLILLAPVNAFDDVTRLEGFYLEEEDSLDMVLMGSSENYAGYSPVLAYEEYGFTSYPYTLSGNAFILFEAQLDEMFRTQSPEVTVVDIGEIATTEFKNENYDTVLRQFAAGMPFSWHKVKTIWKFGDRDDLLSYFFPFSITHGNADRDTLRGYIQTNAALRRRGYSLLKGTLTFTGSGETWDGPYVTPMDTAGDYSTAELSPALLEAAENVIAACKKYPESKFLFINSPHRTVDESQYRNFQRINAIGEILEANGYEFINLESLSDEIGIVPETDFYNNYHMNLYGQYKTTRFLCDILVKEYGIEGSQLSDAARENWETCVAYRPLYYQLFDELFKSRPPGEFGQWLQEDIWLLTTLEEMKEQ